MVDVYDWPQSLIPSAQVFHVPGQAVDGGFTIGGVRTISPEPGGRAVLEWTFNAQQAASAPRLFSWLLNQVAKGTVFRLRLLPSGQTITGPELGLSVPPEYDQKGLPWQGDLYWSNGFGWDFEPGVSVHAAALEGATKVIADFGDLQPNLGHGHAIGLAGSTYGVDDIEYSGSLATITVTPPLRKDVAAGDFLSFRPVMHAVCSDPSAFKSMFDVSGVIRPGSITFVEALI